ncbi:MAG: type II toxin-antitoxin system RelE/ParE family toxin [Chloroflexota bacterium]|nr:type II toxin-antitoxin system RelE/ParE family toxin [Chloroflexota bacterium]
MRQLASRDRDRVIAKVEQFARNPASLANQVTALTGEKHRRLRVGRIRILFSVEQGGRATMVVLRVRHRREAYD